MQKNEVVDILNRLISVYHVQEVNVALTEAIRCVDLHDENLSMMNKILQQRISQQITEIDKLKEENARLKAQLQEVQYANVKTT